MTDATLRAAAVGERALDWLVERRASFAPQPGSAAPVQLVTLGELGLLTHILSRTGTRRTQTALCRSAMQAAYDESAFRRALAEDRSAALHSWLTVLLGLDDAGASDAARPIAAADPNAFAAEQLPHRTLELCWLLHSHGWASPFAPAMDDVYATTFLARPHAIGGASLSDAYAVTHTVAYMTDFGALPFAPAQRAGVITDLNGVLELALTWQNFDLVAEVLAALGWVGAPQTGQGERAWSRLAMQQLPSGAVLGVRGDADLIATLGAAEDPSFFGLLYHSTLVTALASLTVSAGGAAPFA